MKTLLKDQARASVKGGSRLTLFYTNGNRNM
jgi:hypothetical protein